MAKVNDKSFHAFCTAYLQEHDSVARIQLMIGYVREIQVGRDLSTWKEASSVAYAQFSLVSHPGGPGRMMQEVLTRVEQAAMSDEKWDFLRHYERTAHSNAQGAFKVA